MLRKLLFATLAVTILTSGLSQPISINAVGAFLDTDKDEISLGEDLTIRLAEPDANIDSRSIDRIPLDTIFMHTDKFDETPLTTILSQTGIRASQSFLRETGFNTGIFEVTLESINSKLANRGSLIKIIYFDNTASGGSSPVRIQKTIPVVESKIAIVFDRTEYSPYDQMEVKLIAQTFNFDRTKVDTLNAQSGTRVAVTTTSGQTYYPTMFETGISTGVFIGKVQLTPNEIEKNGDLIVIDGDIVRATVLILPGFKVSDLAMISSVLGSIVFDRQEYSAGDAVKVIVADRDENRDLDVIDSIHVRIWSNSDIEGIDLELQETGKSSGLFEASLALSQERSGDKSLFVSPSDVIVVVYKDVTIPSVSKNIVTKDLFATASIGSITRGIMISRPLLVDQNDNDISSVEERTQTIIQTSITNVQADEEAFVYVVHIIDDDGFTSKISFATGTLEPYQSISIGRQWTPDKEGAYTIRVFAWNSLTDPSVFSPVKKTTIVVK
ncbi:MAG: hypothetical protein ACE5KA_01745 [Nitrososphaerales archaeon]